MLVMLCNVWVINCMKVYYRVVLLFLWVIMFFKVVKFWFMEENIEDSLLLKFVSVEVI